ncbi:restriction endonuclease subunit S [Bacillus sp. B15-48]|uniref:restriction endonuclease subunit S n=1 Tax=Bacillus sp. B15-48 TaxID=1548601 RepID=UPI00193F6A82|nr:restriction endonuclease subunit S [Bacillus sp. B15-48]
MPVILTNMLIDKYKNGEISLRQFLNEFIDLSTGSQLDLSHSLARIDPRKYIDIPNELAQLLTDIAIVDHPKKIIDIHCHTGKLLSYFNQADTVKGYHPNEDLITLGKLLYPQLDLSEELPIYKEFTEKYDCVISCFPRLGRMFYEGFEQNIALVYLKKALSLLNDQGKLVTLVSNSFLFTHNAQDFRDFILQNYHVEMIMSLDTGDVPVDLKNMSLIVIKKEAPKTSVFMPHFTNNFQEIKDCYLQNNGFSVNVETLTGSRWDPHYYNPRLNKFDKRLNNKHIRKIEDIADVRLGSIIHSSKRLKSGNYLIVKPTNLENGQFKVLADNEFLTDITENESASILQPGDIITPVAQHVGEIYMYKKTDPPAIASQQIVVIRSTDNEYIKTYLQTSGGRKLFDLQTTVRKNRGGLNKRNLFIRDIKNTRIPLLPITNLNAVSDETMEHASETRLLELKDMLIMLKNKLSMNERRTQELTTFIDNRLIKINKTLSKQTSLQNEQPIKEIQSSSSVDEKMMVFLQLANDIEKDMNQLKNQDGSLNETIEQLEEKLDDTVRKMTEFLKEKR